MTEQLFFFNRLMQFSAEEADRFLQESADRATHNFRLRQHCERIHVSPIENIQITSLRRYYVVTGTVGTTSFRETVLKTEEFLSGPLVFIEEPSESDDIDNSTHMTDSFDLATCSG